MDLGTLGARAQQLNEAPRYRAVAERRLRRGLASAPAEWLLATRPKPSAREALASLRCQEHPYRHDFWNNKGAAEAMARRLGLDQAWAK